MTTADRPPTQYRRRGTGLLVVLELLEAGVDGVGGSHDGGHAPCGAAPF
jgi:hypothetical protein